MQRETLPATVRIASDGDRLACERYLRDCGAATVFHRWEWRDILYESFGHRPWWLLAERAGQIVGLLPLAQVRSTLFGHSLASLPFTSWCGPIADDEQALDQLDRHAVALASELGASHVEYRQRERGFDRCTQDLYVMFARTITGDHERNLAAIPRKQRAMIRKGIARGLISEPGSLAQFYALYADNMHRHGTPACSRRFFHSMAAHFGDDCAVSVVRDPAGQPVSTVLSLFDRDEVLPFYAGDLPAARGLAANDFKYWMLMREAADRGMRSFNFGRSKKGTGSYAFKRNWGFVETQLYYQYWTRNGRAMPQHNPLNPKYRLAIDLWRRLPRVVVNSAGPWVVRGLG